MLSLQRNIPGFSLFFLTAIARKRMQRCELFVGYTNVWRFFCAFARKSRPFVFVEGLVFRGEWLGAGAGVVEAFVSFSLCLFRCKVLNIFLACFFFL